ncbi:MAG: hypothetical protein D9C04_04190 [Nitrosopumilus sp. B06]|nr:MAG: hypothetical protein D9C04_04190 [Nitrosopumilus sp. B06]
MQGKHNGSPNNYTFDTCIGIKMCENPNFGSLLKCRLGFDDSTVHLCTQTILEANNLKYDSKEFFRLIKSVFGASTVEGKVTDEMKCRAVHLEKTHHKLHYGDNYILAYAEATGTILVTCDRGLASAAESIGVTTINPDLIATDVIGRGVRSRFHKTVKNAIKKQSARQIGRLVQDKKIIWRSFN